MHDAIQFERLGVPATAIITDKFQTFASVFANNLAMPGYPMVAMPHPLGTRGDDELRRLAESIADDLLAKLISEE